MKIKICVLNDVKRYLPLIDCVETAVKRYLPLIDCLRGFKTDGVRLRVRVTVNLASSAILVHTLSQYLCCNIITFTVFSI